MVSLLAVGVGNLSWLCAAKTWCIFNKLVCKKVHGHDTETLSALCAIDMDNPAYDIRSTWILQNVLST